VGRALRWPDLLVLLGILLRPAASIPPKIRGAASRGTFAATC